jgi:site-specific DNA recombinase
MSGAKLRAAIYARVSTDKQVECHTIDSQIEAIKERMVADGLQFEAELCFSDGVSGETLDRPALERLRDQVAAGVLDRLYVHSPDRLARKYAYAVLLTDEFRRAGVETIFCNHQVAATPEGELLLQVQGVIAEYERAKILERSRRGRRQAAKRGAVSSLCGAPYGYRYVRKTPSTGEASFQVIGEQAEVVRQVYEWFVQDRLAMHAIARRLTAAEIPTPSGKKRWPEGTVWRILTNPAYQGRARYGRSKCLPRRPRTIALWKSSRRAFTRYRTPAEEQIEIVVPALVSEEVFALAQEQLHENRKRCRIGAEGPRHLLQGLTVCQSCGHSFVFRSSGSGVQKGKHCYYCCTGRDKYRYGGQRHCDNHPARADLLEQVVWEDVRALLVDPARLEQEFRRRQNETEDSGQEPGRPVQRLQQRVQQSVSRLIDAYQEGLLSKEEFEPRLRQTRARLAALEREATAAAQQRHERETFQDALIIFKTFADHIQSSLANADLPTRIKIVRWLIKRIEVDQQQIRIIYKVGPHPFERSRPEGRLQHPSGSQLCQHGGVAVFGQGRPAAVVDGQLSGIRVVTELPSSSALSA